MYSYIWEYQVHPDFKEEFESDYGSRGEWVNLFKRHPAYVRTDLLKDQSDPLRYLTIDTWESFEQYRSFLEKFSREFAALDTKCETYTKNERFLGDFELLG